MRRRGKWYGSFATSTTRFGAERSATAWTRRSQPSSKSGSRMCVVVLYFLHSGSRVVVCRQCACAVSALIQIRCLSLGISILTKPWQMLSEIYLSLAGSWVRLHTA